MAFDLSTAKPFGIRPREALFDNAPSAQPDAAPEIDGTTSAAETEAPVKSFDLASSKPVIDSDASLATDAEPQDVTALTGVDVKEPSFTETMQILRSDDIAGNLSRLGFNIVPQVDEITGEEVVSPILNLERDGEKFVFDVDSIKNQLIGGIRPTAQAAGGLAGGALGFASPVPGGAAAGSILAGTGAGQLTDLAVDFFADQGLGQEQALEQAKQDIIQETVFGLGGEVAGRLARPAAEIASLFR